MGAKFAVQKGKKEKKKKWEGENNRERRIVFIFLLSWIFLRWDEIRLFFTPPLLYSTNSSLLQSNTLKSSFRTLLIPSWQVESNIRS